MSSTVKTMWRRGSRTAPLWLALLTLVSTGCVATKKDVRNLQTQIDLLRAQQERMHTDLLADMRRQDRMLLDTLRNAFDFSRGMSGNLNNQLRELREGIKILEALVGQTQQRLTEAQRQAEAARQQPVPQPVTPDRPSGDPETLYQEAQTKLADKSYATARVIFEQIVSDFPEHPRAADAQFYIGETYYQEKDFAAAYSELERVAERYPTSPRAPGALFRAGAIAEEQRDREKARRFYNLVVSRYRNTDEARRAQDRLRALR